MIPRFHDHAIRLFQGSAHGFFTKDMFTGFSSSHRLLAVIAVRARYDNGVYAALVEKFSVIVGPVRSVKALCGRLSRFDMFGTKGRDLGEAGVTDCPGMILTCLACADDSDSQPRWVDVIGIRCLRLPGPGDRRGLI